MRTDAASRCRRTMALAVLAVLAVLEISCHEEVKQYLLYLSNKYI